MSDQPKDNITSIAVTLGKIETICGTLSKQFDDFKMDHKVDITLLHTLRERLEARVKALEDDSIQRRGGLMSIRTVVEFIAAAAAFAYYVTEMHK